MDEQASTDPSRIETARDELTRAISAANNGDHAAVARLVALVYGELRSLAAARLSRLPPGQTLQATALVHEAYLKLFNGPAQWEGRAHFFGAAARAIRDVLVDRARRAGRHRHGGQLRRVEFDDAIHAGPESDSSDVLLVDDVLRKLEQEDARKAQIVNLRYFAGLTIDETAAALGISTATVEREWAFARAWLHREMSRKGSM